MVSQASKTSEKLNVNSFRGSDFARFHIFVSLLIKRIFMTATEIDTALEKLQMPYSWVKFATRRGSSAAVRQRLRSIIINNIDTVPVVMLSSFPRLYKFQPSSASTCNAAGTNVLKNCAGSVFLASSSAYSSITCKKMRFGLFFVVRIERKTIINK